MDPIQTQAVPIPKKDFQTQIFEFIVKRSKSVFLLFWLVYILNLFLLLAASHQIISRGEFAPVAYDFGKKFGQFSLLLLGFVVIPGILGRFRIEIKITRLITLFRRQLGILVFLFAYSHYILVRFLPSMDILPREPFEFMGSLALSMLFFLFLTSNNLSMRYLGLWWERLHRIIYLILWLVVLHVGLQSNYKWTAIILVAAILEVASLIYDWFLKRKTKAIQEGVSVSSTPSSNTPKV